MFYDPHRHYIQSKSQRECSDKLSDARAGPLKPFIIVFTPPIYASISLPAVKNQQV